MWNLDFLHLLLLSAAYTIIANLCSLFAWIPKMQLINQLPTIKELRDVLKRNGQSALFRQNSSSNGFQEKSFPIRNSWNWNNLSYVRLPFSSRNIVYSQYKKVSKWNIIDEDLKKLQYKRSLTEKNPNLSLGKLVAETIQKWQNSEGYNYGILHLNSDINECLNHTLNFIVDQALKLPDKLSGPIPILKQRENQTMYLTRDLACSLLANAFLCTFPKQEDGRELPYFNFSRLFHWDHNEMQARVKIEKLKCLFQYFITMQNLPPSSLNSIISYERRCSTKKFDWAKCEDKLCPVNATKGRIEDADGMLQMDFANKVVGGGVLNNGTVQEEIRFCISPELICARLFCETLTDNEVLVITGTRKFSGYSGYASTFTYGRGLFHDEEAIKRDSLGREFTQVVAIDALHFKKHETDIQYTKEKIDRELHKCYLAFHQNRHKTPVATGNWGCGAFNGDPQLKFLIQWMAASAQKRPLLQFYECAPHQNNTFFEIQKMLAEQGKSVKDVYTMILEYGEKKKSRHSYWFEESNNTLFDHIRGKLKSKIFWQKYRNAHTNIF